METKYTVSAVTFTKVITVFLPVSLFLLIEWTFEFNKIPVLMEFPFQGLQQVYQQELPFHFAKKDIYVASVLTPF